MLYNSLPVSGSTGSGDPALSAKRFVALFSISSSSISFEPPSNCSDVLGCTSIWSSLSEESSSLNYATTYGAIGGSLKENPNSCSLGLSKPFCDYDGLGIVLEFRAIDLTGDYEESGYWVSELCFSYFKSCKFCQKCKTNYSSVFRA